MLSSKTKVVALVAVSNMLGCILDASYVAEETHRVCLSVRRLFTLRCMLYVKLLMSAWLLCWYVA